MSVYLHFLLSPQPLVDANGMARCTQFQLRTSSALFRILLGAATFLLSTKERHAPRTDLLGIYQNRSLIAADGLGNVSV